MNNSSVLGIIPARFGSTRLPGKLLKEICGKSVLQRVYEQCLKSKAIHRIIIATDHNSIFEHVLSFGGEVILSKKEHTSGTDRISEIAETFQEYPFVINIQGDEPFIDPMNIEILVNLLVEKNCEIASLAVAMNDVSTIENPNIVKLVTDGMGRALYFSRSRIPFQRDLKISVPFKWKKHVGIYGFNRETLLKITQLAPSYLEQIESLEQLRWLENGYQIHIGMIDHHAIGIDTNEDLIQAIRYAENNNL